MDNIRRNNSDSDLSDDWNVIDAKDAPLANSESESIEVLEEEDDDDEEENHENYVNEVRWRNRNTTGQKNSTSSDGEIPDVLPHEIQLIENDSNQTALYCVFPEELHNVFVDTQYSNTSEVMCSISLIILCAVASSLMVISTDNVMPSFLDVLVWQSLPDHQKDININNPGLISEQLKMYKDRNEFLEYKLNHLSLAVKAYEENMVSEVGFVEFVTDLQRLSSTSEEKEAERFKLIDKNCLSASQSFIHNVNEQNYVKRAFSSNDVHKTKESPEEQFIDNSNDSEMLNAQQDQKVRLITKLLTVFNTTTEPGILLKKAYLLLLNSEEHLAAFQKFNPKSDEVKLKQLNSRINTIENNFYADINKFFHRISNKFFDTVKKFDRSLHNYICKNFQSGVSGHKAIFDGWCVGKKHISKDSIKYPHKQENVKKDETYFVKNNDQAGKMSKKLSKFKHSNLYKTDGDSIGKSEASNVGHREMYYKNPSRYGSDVYYERGDDNNKMPPNKLEIEKENVSIFNNSFVTNNFHEKLIMKNNESKINLNEGDKPIVKKSKSKIYSEEGLRRQFEFKKNYFQEKNKNKNKNFSLEDKKKIKTSKTNFNENKSILKSNDLKNYRYKKENNFEETNQEIDDKERKSFEESHNLKNKIEQLKTNTENHSNKKSNNEGKNFKDLKNYNKRFKSDFVGKKHKTEKEGYYNKESRFEDDNITYAKRNKNNEDKFKQNVHEKMNFDELNRFKNDILNSMHSYVDDLINGLKNSYYSNERGKNNNSTNFSNLKLMPGDWFLTLGKKRSEIRAQKRKSEWFFDRAAGRNNLRDINSDYPGNNFYEQTMWFFRRAWERNRYR